jgi:hypothetical protein
MGSVRMIAMKFFGFKENLPLKQSTMQHSKANKHEQGTRNQCKDQLELNQHGS